MSTDAVDAGPYSPWLASTIRARRLPTVGADVPCGTCSGCCRASLFIHIGPSETEALAHIPRALLFPAPGLPEGHVLMGYDEKGHCPMWRAEGCSIYAHRPQTCRDFDCRIFTATGIAVGGPAQSPIAERVAQWRFTYPTQESHAEREAVLATAMFLEAHGDLFPEGMVPVNPTQRALLAIEIHRVMYDFQVEADAGPMPADDVIRDALVASIGASKRGIE